ncbi:MAG: hypothetical protein JNM56_14805 [Planctomycetia bacterium]|nr:hypothetical protein [Planctomycetia bacterium]
MLDLVSKSNGKIHPLELLPDLGASPAKRVEGKAATVIQARSVLRVKPDTALPAALTTTLGKPIRVGDLEVTPLKVEQKRVLFKHRSGKYKPELSEQEALFLHLQMKNVSKDSEFCPTDPAFDYLWKEGRHPENAMPYTFLELAGAGKRFSGPSKYLGT